MDVLVEVYEISAEYPSDERFGLSAQMRRSAVSILSNIAEGCGRMTAPEVRRFLTIARGSAAELEAQLLIAERLDFASQSTVRHLSGELDGIRAMLVGLGRNLAIPKNT